MKTIIIGAGPAGLFSAIQASNVNNDVIIIEKNEKAGKKLFITGKGRCNVTNYCNEQEFISNIVSNPKFMYSAIHAFNSASTFDFFTNNKTPLVIERGNRVFPESYKSFDITDCLVNKCKQNKVKFNFNEQVLDIKKEKDKFIVLTNINKYIVDFVIVATGGISYPLTGSTGDGYKFALDFNHTIIKPVEALTSIYIKEKIPASLYEFTLKNVSLKVIANKFKHEEFGELTFYDNYIDGPIVITTSSLINRKDNIQLYLDLKPVLNNEVLLARINKDISNNLNKKVYDLLKGLMPSNMIELFVSITNIDVNITLNNFSNNNRLTLVNYLKNLPLTFTKFGNFNKAIVTAGGINVKEINPNTMESKLIDNLYFAGEVIDVDAFTGGFNIQIALSTGYVAGKSIYEKTKK